MRPPNAAMMLQITTCPVSFAGKSCPRAPPDSTAAIAGISAFFTGTEEEFNPE